MCDIANAIDRLEKHIDGVPGTIISRVLLPTCIGWSIGIGKMQEPKMFFTGKSIEEALEEAINNISNR